MKIKFVTYLLFIILGLGSCTNEKVSGPSKRTVIVYMVESTNLGSSLQENLDKMGAAATTKNLNNGNLVVYYSRTNQKPELYQIKESKSGKINKLNIKDYPIQSGISPDVMRNVINDVVSLFPSESYGMILSSHGMAWLPTKYTDMLRSFGEENGVSMEIDELAKAIPDNFLEFLLIDACYMGNIECAYELRNKTKYIVASPTEIWDFGFPYLEVIPNLFADEPQLDKTAKQFYEYFVGLSPYDNATVSVVKTSELDNLAEATKAIISKAGTEFIYKLSRTDIQCYDRFSRHLLYDFDQFMERLNQPELYQQFAETRDKAILYKYNTVEDFNNKKFTHHSGLSVYIPREQYPQLNNWYKERLSWYKAVYSESDLY